MDGIQLFSYTPAPTPEPAPLRETPAGKAGPASLSYDVFLNIVDFLIADAARRSPRSAVWKLRYDHAAAARLVVQEKIVTFTKPDKSPSQTGRHRDTLLPAQLTRQTRAMVAKVFPRVTMLDDKGAEMPLQAWIDPARDYFVLDDLLPTRAQKQGTHLAQAITLPTPQGAVLTGSIRRLSVTSGSALHGFEPGAVAVLATLPNLEEMSMSLGRVVPDYQRTVHNGIRAVDPEVYVDLERWARKRGAAFAAASGALQRRGVRVVAGILETTDAWLEILHTAEGVRVRYLMANCSCCKADELY